MVAAGPNGRGRRGKTMATAISFDIAELPTPAGGVIGLASLPGMREGQYRPDMLEHDLDALAGWGPTAVLCLMEQHEVEGLDVERLSFELRRRNVGFVHLPIGPDTVPGAAFEEDWQRLRERLVGAVGRGKRLMVQCVDGRVRCGMAAARLLLDSGSSLEEAMEAVRTARSGALAEAEHEESLRAYSRRR